MQSSPSPQISRVAVVTGGESGIGRAVALRLADLGYGVVVGDLTRKPENRDLFAARKIVSQPTDVRDPRQIEFLIDTAVMSFGGLDVLVNNAGVGMVKPITDVSEEDWDRCLDTNLKAAFFGCKFAVPLMRQRGGGAIVNISSNAGLLPRAHDPVYSISKQALIGLTKALALCHAPDRIRINAVCPGPVDETGMIRDDLASSADPIAMRQQLIAASPMAEAYGRMSSPEEIAAAVEYLVSDASAMVTGTCIAIDGGKSLGVPPKR